MAKTKIAIIGGGPGGYVAAIRAAQLGAAVTLIEKDTLGGTCLNVGCIPTKALLHTAQLYEEAKNGAQYGVVADVRVDFPKAQKHKEQIINTLVSGVSGLLAVNKVTVLKGTASFKTPKTLRISSTGASADKKANPDKKANSDEKELSFDKIIIAAGSVPVMPPIPGIDSPQCIDSSGALALPEAPKSMVIIGGGVIGVELATLYNALGTKVCIIEMMNEILPMMDAELTKACREDLQNKGVEIHTGAKVVGIQNKGREAAVQVEKDGKTLSLSGEKVLVSVGRRANTDTLGMDAIGLKQERGIISVNDKMESNVPGVYAIGDCNGGIMLAHIASVQGEIAAENACGKKAFFDAKTNPSCVYTNPEFAGAGLTEEEAKKQRIEYEVGRFPLMANGKALIMNNGVGLIKIIVGKRYKEILGVHILGPRATDLIAEGALAIGMEATMEDLIATIHAHPTVGEAVREAALAVDKRAIHIPN